MRNYKQRLGFLQIELQRVTHVESRGILLVRERPIEGVEKTRERELEYPCGDAVTWTHAPAAPKRLHQIDLPSRAIFRGRHLLYNKPQHRSSTSGSGNTEDETVPGEIWGKIGQNPIERFQVRPVTC